LLNSLHLTGSRQERKRASKSVLVDGSQGAGLPMVDPRMK
jgi:hypothetical protein